MADVPDERTEQPDQPPRSTAWRWPVLVVVCVLVGVAGGRLLRSGLPSARVRYSADPRLDRAARAVVHGADAKGRPTLVQGKVPMSLPPLAAFLNREHVVRLAAECAGLRGQARRALQADGPVDRRVLEVAGLTVFERGRLCTFLKMDDRQAQLTLYALGWPYVGREGRGLEARRAAGAPVPAEPTWRPAWPSPGPRPPGPRPSSSSRTAA